MSKTEMTPIDARFFEEYIATGNASEAYRRVVDPFATVDQAGRRGWEWAKKPVIKAAVDEYRANIKERAAIGTTDVLLKFLDVWNADPDELLGLRVGCCRYCYGDGFRYQWREREYLEALDACIKGDPVPDIAGGLDFDHTKPPRTDCPECRGEGLERLVPRDTSKLSPGARALFGGVKQTRNGIEIIMGDRHKALENVARILGAFSDKVELTGSLATLAASLTLTTDDPAEAARQYQTLIKSG